MQRQHSQQSQEQQTPTRGGAGKQNKNNNQKKKKRKHSFDSILSFGKFNKSTQLSPTLGPLPFRIQIEQLQAHLYRRQLSSTEPPGVGGRRVAVADFALDFLSLARLLDRALSFVS